MLNNNRTLEFMTDQEINKAIATKCGWTHIRQPDPEFGWNDRPTQRDLIGIPPEKNGHIWVPDYCDDLNAMHDAWCTLDRPQRHEFWGHLARVCDRESRAQWGHGSPNYEIVNATARQRAEAFLRTFGLWKE